MARTNKKRHSSARFQSRGMKCVQFWLSKVDHEHLAHASEITARTMAGLAKIATIQKATKIIEVFNSGKGLPFEEGD